MSVYNANTTVATCGLPQMLKQPVAMVPPLAWLLSEQAAYKHERVIAFSSLHIHQLPPPATSIVKSIDV